MRANRGKTLSKCARITRRTIRDVGQHTYQEQASVWLSTRRYSSGNMPLVGSEIEHSAERVVILGGAIEQFVDE
jgi:hypothetical protein